jgi:NitT/TauT family transport system permease protein
VRAPWKDVGLPAGALVSLLVAWETGFRLAGLEPRLFPPPTRILGTTVALLSPGPGRAVPPLIHHLLVSVARLLAAIALAFAGGVGLGLWMGKSHLAYRAVYPLVNALIPIPAYAYIPILLLWAGRGSASIVAVTALSASLPLIYNTVTGVRGVDRAQVRVLQTFGASPLTVSRRVLLPAALAAIVAGLRLAFGQAWRTLVGAEFIAAPDAGLGSLVFNARNLLQVDIMFAGLFALGVLGFVFIYVLVGRLEDATVVRWGLVARR